MTNSAAQSIALSLGVSALVTVFCRRIRIPALLPLLGVGLLLGTSGAQLVDASSLGDALTGFITVAIGLLIFEGALHLNKEELGRSPRAVWGLLTVGSVITWVGAAAAAHLILGMTVPISVLLGASVIVTGPTVVQPILRIVRVSPKLHTALAAEAVLIDPIGVVATITTLEVIRLYMLVGPQIELASEGLWISAKPLIGGAGVGVVMGYIGYSLLRAVGSTGRPEPQLLNLVAIGVCMTCVGLGEAMTPEAGLAAVTICGVLMARAKVLGATELRAFKELLAVILVGTLFVLLASRFDIARLKTLTWQDAAFVLALIFIIRPIAVAISTWGSKLTIRERLFASTFAPRGIVALSVAAVAAAELTRLLGAANEAGVDGRLESMLKDANRLELVMFAVIAGTVLLASTLSPLAAWVLRVRAGKGTAVLLVGANPLSITLAKLLSAQEIETRVIDSNEELVAKVVQTGVSAVAGDATDGRWMDDVGSLHGTGLVIAWTGNHDVDQLVARWTDDRLGLDHAGIWSSRPARGTLEPIDISLGEPIADMVKRMESGTVALIQTEDPSRVERLLGWVSEKQLTLHMSGIKVPAPNPKVAFIGFAPCDESGILPASQQQRADRQPWKVPEGVVAASEQKGVQT